MINTKFLAEATGKSEVEVRRALRKSNIEKDQKDRFWVIDEKKYKKELIHLFGDDLFTKKG